jgi:hypothetical protein
MLVALINAMIAAVALPLSALPDIAPPGLATMAAGLSGLWAHFGWANKYVPLDQIVIMIGIAVGSWFALYLIRFAVWVYNLIPFKFT